MSLGLDVSKSPTASLSKLAELARQAYAQKRTKDCLDLTRAILLIDPENVEAQLIRSSLQSELQRDLDSERALLRQAQSNPAPENLESPPLKLPDPVSAPSAVVQEASGGGKSRTLIHAGILALVMVVLAVGIITLWGSGAKPKPVEASTLPPTAPAATPTPASEPPVDAASVLPVEQFVGPQRPAPAPDAVAAVPAKPAQPPAAANVANGTLAVSSPTSVDIYKDDVYLGSAPVSLDLPAGTQVLEYRHGNLRRSVAHVIQGHETTKAMITFDVTVQINSRPWAEVYVDGAERKGLGQTPLSNVRVPIGSVLLFENPRFQTKRYRVTGNETGIQIVFP
jgi:hypothetical protein